LGHPGSPINSANSYWRTVNSKNLKFQYKKTKLLLVCSHGSFVLKFVVMFSKIKRLVPEPVKKVYHALQAAAGALIFWFPSRRVKVIGVTGTDGKTTTVYLIHHILSEVGKKASMISTVEAKIGKETIDTGLHVTTPEPFKVQKLLRKIANSKSEYAVLEATSHGLAQERVAFVRFFAGVVTNITHEHLDYHKTYENYLASKAKILRGVKLRILNADDAPYEILKEKGSGQLVSYGIKNEADFMAKNINFFEKGSEFEVCFHNRQRNSQKVKVKANLPGEYNVYNLLAAFAITVSLGVEAERVGEAIASFKGVVGRMQYLDEGQDFNCVVDFAHTPASLEAALKTLRVGAKGKIIAVFGCAGGRDFEKRPMMGKIATELADCAIFTAEDPRSEDINRILEQMAGGALSVGGIPNRTFWKIADRAEAINTAIGSLAQKGDIVVLFGKGHEKSMNISGVEYPWSDEEAARNALKVRLRK